MSIQPSEDLSPVLFSDNENLCNEEIGNEGDNHEHKPVAGFPFLTFFG